MCTKLLPNRGSSYFTSWTKGALFILNGPYFGVLQEWKNLKDKGTQYLVMKKLTTFYNQLIISLQP